MARSRSNKGSRKAEFLKKILSGDQRAKLACFSKRIPTLKKKSLELQTLCGNSVCFVCFGPDGNVDVWPEQEAEVKAKLSSYKGLIQNQKREMDSLKILETKKNKLLKTKNRVSKKKVDELLKRLSKLVDESSGDPLMNLIKLFEQKSKGFQEQIQSLNIAAEASAAREHVDNKANLDLESMLKIKDDQNIQGPIITTCEAYSSFWQQSNSNNGSSSNFAVGAMESSANTELGILPEAYDLRSGNCNGGIRNAGCEMMINTDFLETNYCPSGLQIFTNNIDPVDAICSNLIMEKNGHQDYCYTNSANNNVSSDYDSDFLSAVVESNNSYSGFVEENNAYLNAERSFGMMGEMNKKNMVTSDGDDQELLICDVLPIEMSMWDDDQMVGL